MANAQARMASHMQRRHEELKAQIVTAARAEAEKNEAEKRTKAGLHLYLYHAAVECS